MHACNVIADKAVPMKNHGIYLYYFQSMNKESFVSKYHDSDIPTI